MLELPLTKGSCLKLMFHMKMWEGNHVYQSRRINLLFYP